MDRFDFFAGDMLGMWVPLFLILLGAGLVWIKRFSRRSTKKMVVPSAPIPPQASDEPAVKRAKVKFARGWYECRPISADPSMGLGVVQLTDRRTHSRPIIRRLSEIRLA